jgi:hypothetical protein
MSLLTHTLEGLRIYYRNLTDNLHINVCKWDIDINKQMFEQRDGTIEIIICNSNINIIDDEMYIIDNTNVNIKLKLPSRLEIYKSTDIINIFIKFDEYKDILKVIKYTRFEMCCSLCIIVFYVFIDEYNIVLNMRSDVQYFYTYISGDKPYKLENTICVNLKTLRIIKPELFYSSPILSFVD